ncbi:MAG: hypothetical protein KDI98_06785 [Hyphomicrobiaceae bacterium]|nr:hypothetical protein [Hyphomicrobiaceae bacterium]
MSGEGQAQGASQPSQQQMSQAGSLQSQYKSIGIAAVAAAAPFVSHDRKGAQQMGSSLDSVILRG